MTEITFTPEELAAPRHTCGHGGIHGGKGLCVKCYDAQRYAANRKRVLETKRLDRIANPEKYRRWNAVSRERNKDKRKIWQKKYYETHIAGRRASANARGKIYYQTHKQQIAEYGKKRRREKASFLKMQSVQKMYGLDRPALTNLLTQQNYACPCGVHFGLEIFPAGRRRPWAIDHDHTCCSGQKSCGKCVRGILCNRCNQVLGMLDEDPRLLPEFLILYLNKYKSVGAAAHAGN